MPGGEISEHLQSPDEILRRLSPDRNETGTPGPANGRSRKILIYSSDSFSLGHLRQCRAIANSLVDTFDTLSVLILSGSPIIGRFEFPSRVDFVRVPGVTQVCDGEHMPLSLHLNIDHTVRIRSSIIQNTAEVFAPDILIVDREPLGLCGELLPTLKRLRETDTHIVLGLRDVVDTPSVLQRDWKQKNICPALERLYDEIWIYGSKAICDPVEGIDLPGPVMEKIRHTGFLRCRLPEGAETVPGPFALTDGPHILVRPGGGGVELVEWVMRAYEARTTPLLPALVILPPFLPETAVADLIGRARRLPNVSIMRFTPQIEPYLANAAAIVGTGGYNTFCEVLSFDKPALMVPPGQPGREQTIRSEQARLRGLVNVLPIDRYPDPAPMAEALAALPKSPRPSSAGPENLLGGLDAIGERVGEIFGPDRSAQRAGCFRPAETGAATGPRGDRAAFQGIDL